MSFKVAEKRFDKITINNILTETVLKLPDEVLTSFIVSYLNSNESTKLASYYELYSASSANKLYIVDLSKKFSSKYIIKRI